MMTAHIFLMASLALAGAGVTAFVAPEATVDVSAWWAQCFEHDDAQDDEPAQARKSRQSSVVRVDADVDVDVDADVRVRI